MDIKRNVRTGGLYTVVEKKGQHYVLDLSYTLDHGVECMAFECDADGHVTSFEDHYVSFPKTISNESLEKCVEEFLAQ